MVTYVNADVLAQGLAGFDPAAAAWKAGQIMLDRLQALSASRKDIAFESTLAGRSSARFLEELSRRGYHIKRVYFWFSGPESALARVAQRVAKGGHDIPEATVRKRYARSLRNFFDLYAPLADMWQVYDNSSDGQSRLIAY